MGGFWAAAAGSLLAFGTASVHPAEDTPIEDNSFLLEEAYNQDPGVVQHIVTHSRSRGGGWTTTFTQEWPVAGRRHQIAVSVPVEGEDGGRGVLDSAVHYRLQAVGQEPDSRLAVAPRISLLLPTGDERDRRGSGGLGFEAGLPASWPAGRRLVLHGNLSTFVVPRGRNEAGERVRERGGGLGASAVWLVRPRLNVLFETIWRRAEKDAGGGRVFREREFFASPGVRFALRLAGGLEIVPGIAAPIGLGPSRGARQLLFYLSFEHPFRKSGREAVEEAERPAPREKPEEARGSSGPGEEIGPSVRRPHARPAPWARDP